MTSFLHGILHHGATILASKLRLVWLRDRLHPVCSSPALKLTRRCTLQLLRGQEYRPAHGDGKVRGLLSRRVGSQE